uniref:Uncharacterized protein n=1 Tax=Romanomermis culicivorax TaxID=13658 RepID=A0A915KVA7_ROMCU
MKLSLFIDGKRDASKMPKIAAPSKKLSTKTFNDPSATAYSPLRSTQLLTKNAAVRRQPENRNDEVEDMEVDRDLITKALFNTNNKDDVSTGKNGKNEQSVQFTATVIISDDRPDTVTNCDRKLPILIQRFVWSPKRLGSMTTICDLSSKAMSNCSKLYSCIPTSSSLKISCTTRMRRGGDDAADDKSGVAGLPID